MTGYIPIWFTGLQVLTGLSVEQLSQWRTQDFRMGGVGVLQAPREVGHGEGYPPPVGEGSGEGAVLPPQKFFVFFVENTIF